MSSLHAAVLRDSFSSVEKLIKDGFDINVRDRSLRNALHVCLESKNPNAKMIAFLIEAGIKTKNSMYHYCCNSNRLNPNIMALLVAGGEDLTQGLHHTIGRADIELTQWFLDEGADATSICYDYPYGNPNPVICEEIDPVQPTPRNLLHKIALIRPRRIHITKIYFVHFLMDKLGREWLLEQSQYVHKDGRTALDSCTDEDFLSELSSILGVIQVQKSLERSLEKAKSELGSTPVRPSRNKKNDIL